MKRIWIVNYYTETPQNVSNPRYLQFAHYFQKEGYVVTTFNASYKNDNLNNEFKHDIFLRKQYGEYDFVHVKTPHYQGNGLKRMISIWMFAWRLFRHYKQFERPDIILHNMHTPFDYPIIWMSKRAKAMYIAELWDSWPDNFVKAGLVSRYNPFMMLAYYLEKKAYYYADQIVFTYMGAFDYLKKHGWTTETGGRIDLSKVHYINNGVDIKAFDHDKEAYPRSDYDLNRNDVYKIVYVGSLSQGNQVDTLIDAAAILQKEDNYLFFIYGDGTYRNYLENYIRENHIKNVRFKEKKIPLYEVAWVVSQATVNVMNYTKVFGYLGVSSGKLFQYLAAGKPIVCNIRIEYDDIITDNNLGIAKEIETAEEYANIIRALAEQETEDYNSMCNRVREVGVRFDYSIIAAKELEVIRKLTSNNNED